MPYILKIKVLTTSVCIVQPVDPLVILSINVELLNLFDVSMPGSKIIEFYTGYSCDFSHNWVNCLIRIKGSPTMAA